jgi:hypothetical protein
MRPFLLCVLLFLIIPMAILNPMGRDAFLGYYAGVIATWAISVIWTWRRPAPQPEPDPA